MPLDVCKICGTMHYQTDKCRPLKVAEEARKMGAVNGAEILEVNHSGTGTKLQRATIAEKAAVDHRSPEATIAAPLPKRGRPKTITDMRTYKANKAKQYRALAKAKTTD